MLDSYGSEGERIIHKGERRPMANGDGRGGPSILDALLKYSQLVAYPVFVGLIIIWGQMNALDKRLVSIETGMSRPSINDVNYAREMAIMKDRQETISKKLDAMMGRMDELNMEFERHRLRSDYDNPNPWKNKAK